MARSAASRSERVQSDRQTPTVDTGVRAASPSPDPSTPQRLVGALDWTWKVTTVVWTFGFLTLLLYEWFSTLYRMVDFYRPSTFGLPVHPVYSYMVVAALTLFALLFTPLVATRKGYAWFFWTISGGLLGLIVLACLRPVEEEGTSQDVRTSRLRLGNRIGACLSAVTLLGIAALLVTAL